MFERFTDEARRAVVLAQSESKLLDHNYIGTEHLLLGLAHPDVGLSAKVLVGMGLDLDEARRRVTESVGRGLRRPTGHIPFTPRFKEVLELSLREAIHLEHEHIGSEHLLLGLVHEGGGVAARVLSGTGAGLGEVREAVLRSMGAAESPDVVAGPRPMVPWGDHPADRIRVTGIRVFARHGVFPEEQARGQEFVVDVALHLDLAPAGRGDGLAETVDYGDLAKRVHDRVAGERWDLIERVAERVAELVLEDGRVAEVEVTVHKPQAPLAVVVSDVSVTVRRRR